MKPIGEYIIEVLEWITQAFRSFPSRYYTGDPGYDESNHSNLENDGAENTTTERDKENTKTGGL